MSTITLTYDGVTELLSDRLQWTDEYEWSPIDQATTYSTEGALMVDQGEKLAGQPITLDGDSTQAWMTRAQCDRINAWAALKNVELVLTLRGVDHPVIFDHSKGGFTARAVWKLQDSQIKAVIDGAIEAELLYLPTFRFLKV